jgi:S1-C subfamily serine protease
MEQLFPVSDPDYTRASGDCRGRGIRLSLVIVFACLWLAVHSASANSLPDTIDQVRQSVVAVGSYHPSGSPRQIFRGTGFVIDNGHLVVTNHHVLPGDLNADKKEALAVFSGRGRKARRHIARIVAQDPEHDLALLYISSPLPALSLASSGQVREGSEIAFTGFPLGMALGLYPVTHRGMVSAISPMAPPQANSRTLTAKAIRAMRNPYDVLQLDATAYPGNSGSPVYDQRSGAVVGVINSVLVKGGKEAAIEKPSGISYAIPVHFVRELLKKAPQ